MGAQLVDVWLGNTCLNVNKARFRRKEKKSMVQQREEKVGGIGSLTIPWKSFKIAISKEHRKGTVMGEERSCLEVVSSEEMLEILIEGYVGVKDQRGWYKEYTTKVGHACSKKQRSVMEWMGSCDIFYFLEQWECGSGGGKRVNKHTRFAMEDSKLLKFSDSIEDDRDVEERLLKIK